MAVQKYAPKDSEYLATLKVEADFLQSRVRVCFYALLCFMNTTPSSLASCVFHSLFPSFTLSSSFCPLFLFVPLLCFCHTKKQQLLDHPISLASPFHTRFSNCCFSLSCVIFKLFHSLPSFFLLAVCSTFSHMERAFF